jgi:hypothetical protein
MGNLLTTAIARTTNTTKVLYITSDSDPRSPTTAFRRTPLRFLRRTAPDLNDPRSPMCNRTPLKLAVTRDPREPTAGLVRTPVPAVVDDVDLLDPREPTDGLVRTPVPKVRSARRRLVLDDDDAVDADAATVASTPFADCCSELDEDSFVDVDLDDTEPAESAADDDDSDAPTTATTSMLFRSPVVKSRSLSMRFSQIQSKFAARTPSSLRKVMARQTQPAPHDSPHTVRLIDSCPSSPVAA